MTFNTLNEQISRQLYNETHITVSFTDSTNDLIIITDNRHDEELPVIIITVPFFSARILPAEQYETLRSKFKCHESETMTNEIDSGMTYDQFFNEFFNNNIKLQGE